VSMTRSPSVVAGGKGRQQTEERNMPVIAVIWGLGLLAAIALSLSWNGNVSYGMVRNSLEAAQVNAVVEAATNRAVVALLDARPDRRWKTDSTPYDFAFEGTRIKVSMQDELGKIDLNQAEESAIVNLLQSVGLDPSSATELADKILDWRTTTSLKHLNGAKELEYRASGNAFQPRNGPFQSVDELLLVMGMTAEIFRRVEPALTVYSGHQFIDPQVAPREALQALPNMTPDAIAAALAARASLPSDGATLNGMTSLNGRAFTIRTEFQEANRAIRHEAVVRITDDPKHPFWLLSWKYK
jgi:general secretion pathway protein K